jgi:hypothetical protein
VTHDIGNMASKVRGAVITDAGHWIMEEQTNQAVLIISRFIKEE